MLRAFIAHKVPFLVTSATLPPLVLAQVHTTVHMQADTSYHLNLGTDRSNIAWFVRRMTGAKKDFESLAFLIPNATDNVLTELVQTMAFFDDINVALEAMKWIQSRLPLDLHSQIAVYNSRRSKRAKHRVLQDYRKGRVKILLTTEAAGMVCCLQIFLMIELNIMVFDLEGLRLTTCRTSCTIYGTKIIVHLDSVCWAWLAGSSNSCSGHLAGSAKCFPRNLHREASRSRG